MLNAGWIKLFFILISLFTIAHGIPVNERSEPAEVNTETKMVDAFPESQETSPQGPPPSSYANIPQQRLEVPTCT
jgi:hypothetical protein